jgi:GxxExxY protein
MTENDLSYLIRGSIFRVNTNVGPGLLESAYEMALCHELRKDGLEVQRQVGLPFEYGDEKLDIGYRMDIVVNNRRFGFFFDFIDPILNGFFS